MSDKDDVTSSSGDSSSSEEEVVEVPELKKKKYLSKSKKSKKSNKEDITSTSGDSSSLEEDVVAVPEPKKKKHSKKSKKPKKSSKQKRKTSKSEAEEKSSMKSEETAKNEDEPSELKKKKATISNLFGEKIEKLEASSRTTTLRSNHMNQFIECKSCQIIVPKCKLHIHQRTNLHKSNCSLKTDFENIQMIATAFKNRIITYRLSPKQDYLTPEAFLFDNLNDITRLILTSLTQNNCIKICFELFANFILSRDSETHLKSFNTKYFTVFNSTNIHDLCKSIIDIMMNKFIEFEHSESGWSFQSISHLEININKYCPLRGGTYLELPKNIRNTKSCLNIKNKDSHCFLWSVVAALYPAKTNSCRISSYPHYLNVFNIKNMSFPPTFHDVKLFEQSNSVSINIYGLDKKSKVTGPLYFTNCKRINHVNLLYIESNQKGHYCLIKDLMRLVKRQVSRTHVKMYFCDGCLQFFTSEPKLKIHSCSRIITILPNPNQKLKFEHFERQQKVNFVIYADFESLLINYNKTISENTHILKRHQPSSFGYYICCSHDQSLNKYVHYRGPDCEKQFVKYLMQDTIRLSKIISCKKPMIPLTQKQQQLFENATLCHICKQLLLGDKNKDHDHITGIYRGPAHSKCNLSYRVCPFIPIFFHNLSGYDSHFFIEELTKYEGDIYIIPKSKEKYISITKKLKSHNISIKFLDSFQFLSSSLDKLSHTLDDNNFIHLSKEFPNKQHFKLMREKGVYPYDYMDSWEKYSENSLPQIECFYNNLKLECVSNKEYLRAQKIWDKFNICNLGEYTDLYLKSDVLLLCDIFENFRNISLEHYNLDPAYYVTSPGLSWDAMLQYTKVELDLISDLEVHEFLEKGIRGGLAQCSLRHAKANNKYLDKYDPSKPTNYLIYLDCNNLYGYAMMQKLPISNFDFLKQKDIEYFDISKVGNYDDYGYILEVDLTYPKHLHNIHSDLPFAPEKLTPPDGKSPKLIANLYDKYKYVIHYVHLKECLRQGLVLKKIHRILKFRQSAFLKRYIDLNTTLRQASSSSFHKDFFKLLNNSIFGKTIENKRKQVNVKLVSSWNCSKNKTNKMIGARDLIAKPNITSIAVFNENFVAIQLKRDKLVLDRPIYIGFTVLELAKYKLYQFHYNYIKKKYNNNAMLCYTDTDSLLYSINTNNFYKDMKKDISQFDTSNFSENNQFKMPRLNAQVPGLFKYELGEDVLTEFVGLRAKLYCINTLKTKITKAKGVSKSVTKRLNMSDYHQTLTKNVSLKMKMTLIKSIKHVLYSEEVNKLVLNRSDDKRVILSNHINTLPWGHFAVENCI